MLTALEGTQHPVHLLLITHC